jgi:uncharacterized membrane protein
MARGVASPTETRSTLTQQGWRPPCWASPTALLLAVGGLSVSSYLTIAHYGSGVALACPNTGVVNCEKVTTSPQSVIAGLPVAVLGLVFFGAMALINLPRAWRSPSLQVRVPRVALSITGVAFAMYLVFTELFTIHAICLWCTSAHAAAFLLFAVVLFGESLGRSHMGPIDESHPRAVV